MKIEIKECTNCGALTSPTIPHRCVPGICTTCGGPATVSLLSSNEKHILTWSCDNAKCDHHWDIMKNIDRDPILQQELNKITINGNKITINGLKTHVDNLYSSITWAQIFIFISLAMSLFSLIAAF